MSKKNKETNRFYDIYLFKTILDLSEIDVLEGIEKFESYLKKYPEDSTAQCFYASNLIKIRKFDEAEKILDKVEEKYNTVKFDEKKEEILYKNLCFTKIKLLCYQGKYKECVRLCRTHHEILQKYEISYGAIIHYCLTMLNNKIERNYATSADKYFFQQLENYSEEELKKHVNEHLVGYKSETNEAMVGFFFKDFPFDRVFEEVKKSIPDKDRGYCYGFLDDTYYFKYDDCGRCLPEKDRKMSKDKNYQSKLMVTNYFKVITFHDSPNIITICPCENTQGLSYIDFNYLKDEEIEKAPMVKKKSQIDKFYERYQKRGQ